MSKIQSSLIVPHQFDEVILANSNIILDTNILIELSIQNKGYFELFEKFNEKNCTYLTSDICYYEFMKISRSKKEMDIKKKLFANFEIVVLPTGKLTEEFEFILSILRGKNVSLADIMLGALLKKYEMNNNIFLLTSDIKDFGKSIYERKIIFNVSEEEQIKNIILCRLNTDESNIKASHY